MTAPSSARPKAIAIPLILILSLAGVSCSPGQFIRNPVATSGLELNSPYREVEPQIAGRFLAFVSDRNGSQDIYLWDLTGRRLVPVPNLNRFEALAAHPSVSEDGRYLVFAASDRDRWGIYLYDLNSQRTRRIANNLSGEIRNPQISANGERIVFEVNLNGQWDIAVYDRNGRPLSIATNPR